MRTQRSFGSGLLVGVAGTMAVAALLGLGSRPAADNWFVTSGHDGRTAYLWEQAGGSIRCVGTAEAKAGKDDKGGDNENAGGGKNDDQDKGKDKDKGKPDDKGKGKGKGGN